MSAQQRVTSNLQGFGATSDAGKAIDLRSWRPHGARRSPRELDMNPSIHLSRLYRGTGVIAVATMFAACSGMTHTEKDTTVGAGGGAVAGAVVGGPVGAVVGAGIGGVAGHEVGKDHTAGRSAVTGEPMPSAANAPAYNPGAVRSVQQALNDKGYGAGPADGTWGPSTETALRRFQEAQGLPVTGRPDARTRAALGVG